MTTNPHWTAAARPARSSINTAAALDLSRQTDGFTFAGVHVQGEVHGYGLAHHQPGRSCAHPLLDLGGRIGVLQLGKDGWGHDDLLEQARQYFFVAAR